MLIRLKFLSIIFFSSLFSTLYSQNHFEYNKNIDLTSIKYIPYKNLDGFSISFSLVAMFTSGSIDRNGFRIGGGMTISYTENDWKLSTGLDMYKVKEKFGIGTTFAGIQYDNEKYSGSYYLNKYWQGDKQISGIIGLKFYDFGIRFEDDILSLPFTSFVVYDRYRSAAIELEYKGFLLGTNVYTNEPNGLTEEIYTNKRGIYKNGKQLSSAIYLGYTNRNLIFRYGMNNKTGGYLGQNWWHEKLFNTCNFESGGQNNHFLQVGINKPYTLY